MLIRRPADRAIRFSYFGAPHAMPSGTILKVGDTVTLKTATAIVEAKISEVLVANAYRGTATDIEATLGAGQRPAIVRDAIQIGATFDFEECHVHSCMRAGI